MRLRLLLPVLLLASCQAVPVGDTVPVFGGYTLHFSTVGDLDDLDEGESVLVVPAASYLAADAMRLAEGRPVVFYDGRGRGRSDAVDDPDLLGLERDIADLEMLRRHLGLDSFSLLAWSYDAAVATAYARRAPNRVERLILVAPIPLEPHWAAYEARVADRMGDELRDQLVELAESPLRTEDPAAFGDAFTRAFLRAHVADPEVLDDMRARPAVAPNLDPIVVAARGQHATRTVHAYEWDAWLPGLAVPTLIVHGAADPIPLAASLAWKEACPSIELVVLDDVGHLPWLEAPGRFFPLVERFLRGESALPARP